MVHSVKCLGLIQINQCPAKAGSIPDLFYDISHEVELIVNRPTGDGTNLCIPNYITDNKRQPLVENLS